MTPDEYTEQFPSFGFSSPGPRLLRVELTAPNGNEINSAFHGDLTNLWPTISADDDVEVVIVCGANQTFSSGASADLIDAMINNPKVRERTMKEARDIVVNVLNFDKPLVSVMQGQASGPALAVALLADVSIAATDARLRDGHNAHGVAAGDHAAICWPLLCGMAKAKYLLMTSTPVTGELAERMGLISLTAGNDQVHELALEVAGQLLSETPHAVRWTKHTLNHWFRQMYPTFDASLMYEVYGFIQQSERTHSGTAPTH